MYWLYKGIKFYFIEGSYWVRDTFSITENQAFLVVWLVALIYLSICLRYFFQLVPKFRTPILIVSIAIPYIFLSYPIVALLLYIGRLLPLPKLSFKKRIDYPFWTFKLPVAGKQFLHITNPFRGIFITGGAGAGKSKSVVEPLIYQSIEKEYTGILYDYEYPMLTKHVWAAFRKHNPVAKDYYINFTDLSRSHRLNPLDPQFLTSSSYAKEYSTTILSNLLPESITNKKDFWIRSAESLLTAIIWYLREEEPKYCTLPHAVSLLLTENIPGLLEQISDNPECAGMVASIRSGLISENQTAGVLSTAQNAIFSLNTPEIFWVLSGNDLTLDLNNPKEPKFLCIGNSPGLSDTYGSVISLIISAALKVLNRPDQQHSILLIDELPTLYIPNLERVPATGRKNKVATVFVVQDYSQLEDKYGEKKTEVMVSVLANQFFGKTTNPKTAERISRMYGKYDQAFESVSRSSSASDTSTGYFTGSSTEGKTMSRSTSWQERQRVKTQDLVNLDAGEFYGNLVESDMADFRVQFEMLKSAPREVEVFRQEDEAQVVENYRRIKLEVKGLLENG